MKRKLTFLLVLLGIVGIAIGAVKVITNRTPKLGVLKVQSNPGASLFLENKHLGSTPFEDKVDEGEYTVKIVPETSVTSLASWQGKITIAPNLLTYINADLGETEFQSSVEVLWLEKITSKQSELSVITNPDGAMVSVDGESKGNTPLTLSNITTGDHTILVTNPGFVSRTVKVKTTAGYKLISSLKMALSDEVVASSPSAEVDLQESPEPSSKTTPTPSKKTTPTPTKKATPSATLSVTPKATPKATPTQPEKPYVTIDDTPTGFLRVRAEASTAAAEIGRVNPGEMFHLLDEENGWYKIAKFDGESDGWISGQYATKVE